MFYISVPVGEIAEALLMRMSIPPKFSTAFVTASLTCISSRISTSRGSAVPPESSISFAAVKIVPGSFGCGFTVFAAMTIFALIKFKGCPIDYRLQSRLQINIQTIGYVQAIELYIGYRLSNYIQAYRQPIHSSIVYILQTLMKFKKYPSAAHFLAIESPIPRDAPVINILQKSSNLCLHQCWRNFMLVTSLKCSSPKLSTTSIVQSSDFI